MDPGRAAMISGRGSPERRERRERYDDRRDDRRGDRRDRDRDRDLTAPRRDDNHRITKPWDRRGTPQGADRSTTRAGRGGNGSGGGGYMTEEQLSEKFVAEEDKFVLRQSKKKADIRVRERRAQPVDFLAFHLRFVDSDRDAFDDEPADVETDVPLPDAVLASVAAATDDPTDPGQPLAALEADIRSFRTLEQNAANRAYWDALLVLCRDAAAQQMRARHEASGGGGGGGNEARLLSTVADDIDGILRPKTLLQLEALERSIRAKLQSDEAIDADYWGQLLQRLQVWKARATVRKTSEAVRAARAALLQERDPAKAEAVARGWPVDTKDKDRGRQDQQGETGQETAAAHADASGDGGIARFAATAGEDASQATKALYDREVARGVQENEEIFSAEEAVPAAAAAPAWADKYRPRKPRYFNRVQMGYEWNKYNQTHYDHDNPPPKVVQGYKFNIFYPELLDATKAPTYRIIREGGRRRGESFAPAGEEDTCLIRFSAGPPYDDLAFRIVDREWDYSAKRERGFKSSFEKGILQLHFQFKKIFYRK